MIEPGLVTRLKAQVTGVSSRVYPTRLPQAVTYPAISYQLISDPRLHSGDGADRLVSARYRVTAWGLTYASAKTIGDAVRSALDGFSGTLNSHAVALIRNVGGRDSFEDDAGDEGVYGVSVDYMISYTEGA